MRLYAWLGVNVAVGSPSTFMRKRATYKLSAATFALEDSTYSTDSGTQRNPPLSLKVTNRGLDLGSPNNKARRRSVPLNKTSVTALRAHSTRQNEERLAALRTTRTPATSKTVPHAKEGPGCGDGQPLEAHKGETVRELIEGRGCELIYLPPYSPEFNPIEGLLQANELSQRDMRSWPTDADGGHR
jgi:hypothetical protein